MNWLSIDPGQVHVGVAEWNGSYMGPCFETTVEGVLDLVEARAQLGELDLVVIERFALMSPKYTRQKAGQAVDTIKLIGMIEGVCRVHRVEVIEQEPVVRHVAMKSPFWRVLTAAIPANDHARSAAAHGLYALKFGKLKHRLRVS